MPAWATLQQQFASIADNQQRNAWLFQRLLESLNSISSKRDNRNVILYASAFLQKPTQGLYTQITQEDINGFMSVMHGMDWDKGLTLILHTPGGVTTSTETIVDYLREKFGSFEVIIPTYAMSAGTMISLASEKIVMAKQSQMGPIDPQMQMKDRPVSAGSIVAQFERAKSDIIGNRDLAHLWAPVLQTIGPALLEEAQNALDYSEKIVRQWLETGMASDMDDSKSNAVRLAKFFNDSSEHKSHGRRISRADAKAQGIVIEDLEDDNDLQDFVLTAYHLATILFDASPASKALFSNTGNPWIKNLRG